MDYKALHEPKQKPWVVAFAFIAGFLFYRFQFCIQENAFREFAEPTPETGAEENIGLRPPSSVFPAISTAEEYEQIMAEVEGFGRPSQEEKEQHASPQTVEIHKVFESKNEDKTATEVHGVDFVGESAQVVLTMSLPKSGTTALEWIIQSIFDNFKLEIEKRSGSKQNEQVEVYQKGRRHVLKYKEKMILARFANKHREDPSPLKTRRAVSTIISEKIPASSDAALSKLPGGKNYLGNVTAMASQVDPHSGQKFLAIFRDPVAASVSNVYYHHGLDIGKDFLGENVVSAHNPRNCEKYAATLALRYRIITEIMPKLGIEIHPLFFDEMRTDPETFVSNLATALGLSLSPDIVRKVVSETSPEHMKKIQDSGAVGHYKGLAKSGTNSRKIRKASLHGYMNELPPAALQTCVAAAKFHLPEALVKRFELDV